MKTHGYRDWSLRDSFGFAQPWHNFSKHGPGNSEAAFFCAHLLQTPPRIVSAKQLAVAYKIKLTSTTLVMFLIPLIVIVAFVVFFIRRENKQSLIRQWQLAADSLAQVKCDPGGTLSGSPTLYGYIEGRRIDVAAFCHREFGSSSTQMTGYRVKRNSPIDLPPAAIISLSNHFPKFEIDSERIFCGTNGVEKSASNLTSAVNRIAAALRLADTEHTKNDLAQSEKDLVETLASVKNEPPPPLEKDEIISPITEIPKDLPADQIPAYLRQEKSAEAAAIANAIDEQDPPFEMESEPQPAAVVVNPAPPIVAENAAEISESPLTLAARDLFTFGHNHFETTQRFSSQYDQQDVSGRGILRRVEIFSNDRFFGRGPGILAEIEIDCPQVEIANAEEETGSSSATSPPSQIKATIEITVDENEDTSPNSIARVLRERIGEPVEVCGTLIRCDAFDARLFLKSGIVA